MRTNDATLRPGGIELVPTRPLVAPSVDVQLTLHIGDRLLVAAGDTVSVGTPLIERFRETVLTEVPVPEEDEVRPGERVSVPQTGRRRPGTRAGAAPTARSGELLFAWRGGWRVAAGDHGETLDSPLAGTVLEATAGVRIVIRSAGRSLRGVVAIGGPSRGRLQLAAGPGGHLPPGGLDVGLAGTILVVGARVDAETLTRARAMGVRGIVVAGLPSKERRDFLASEARQRAALHRLPPFAVLVLDGAVRRPIAAPIVHLLEALEGRDVVIVNDPPGLVFHEPEIELPVPSPNFVRVRSGPEVGREGRWLGSLGLRRFERGVHLEAARVIFPEGPAVVPVGDLERFT